MNTPIYGPSGTVAQPNTQIPPKTIIESVPDFLDYCELEKGLRDGSQENYRRFLDKLGDWLKSQNLGSLLPHQLTSDHIWNYRLYLSRYQNYRTGRQLAKSTQYGYLIALRCLLSYFVAKDISSLPPAKITLPKRDMSNQAVKFLTIEQVGKLLSSIEPIDKITIRDRAILETLFSTGLRVSELTSLNYDQFANMSDSNDMELGVIGKGGKPRVVYFSQRALGYIKKYLEAIKKIKNENTTALFINFRDKFTNVDTRLSTRAVERLVKKYAILSGIPVSTTPHTLRHSYATDLMNQGVDLRSIQEFLGHSNIATTQIYTHVTNKRLRDIHHQFHSNPDRVTDIPVPIKLVAQ